MNAKDARRGRSMIGVLLVCASANAAAGLSGRVSLATAEIYRGVKQTRDVPVVDGLVQYDSNSGFYGAVWAGQVEFPYSDEGSDVEVDYIVGIGRALTSRIFVDSAVVRYSYPSSSAQRNYDWTEWYTSLRFFDHWSVGVGIGHDWLDGNRTTHNAELTYQHRLPLGVTIDLTGGYQDVSGVVGRDYRYYEVGLGRVLRAIQFRIAFSGTDAAGSRIFGPSGAARWLGRATWSF